MIVGEKKYHLREKFLHMLIAECIISDTKNLKGEGVMTNEELLVFAPFFHLVNFRIRVVYSYQSIVYAN